jgi:magnesium transporter
MADSQPTAVEGLPELMECWPDLDGPERGRRFLALPRPDQESLFFALDVREQAALVRELPPVERRGWMRILPPDDAADVVQALPGELRKPLLDLLDDAGRREVQALLAYAEDEAGGLMNPRYARLRPDMTVDEAIAYLRRQLRERVESIYYTYVLDQGQRLLGVVSLRELFAAPPDRCVRDVMVTDLVTVREDTDQEAVSRLFRTHDFLALPVVDGEGRMKGIVTVDDVIDVMLEEAGEDIQKIGAVGPLETTYSDAGVREMIRKRIGWLAILFLGEMLTASAMAYFEGAIARAVVLALFIPLIISSGGNSGSQASTLVIRALALDEVRLRDITRVLRRELVVGLALGAVLGAIGFARIAVWHWLLHSYGPHWLGVAATVSTSLVGVVLWGSLAGSALPFVLRRLGFDPASASAPFVATLVDVSGLVIYFTVASLILRGVLL